MRFSLTAIIFLITLFYNCKGKTKIYEPTYSVDTLQKKTLLYGVPTQAHYETHSAIVNYLNDHLKEVHIRLVASSEFTEYVSKVNNGFFDLAIANGLLALSGKNSGYSFVGESVGEEPNAGAILVHKDSLIGNFSDLKGRSIATPGSPALPGHMLQMLYLLKKGVDVNKDINVKYVESFESVILNLYLGKCSAGFTTMVVWHAFLKKRPEVEFKVALKWVTAAAPGNTLLVRNNIDKRIVTHLNEVLLAMHMNSAGRKALADIGYTKFIRADSTTFLPLKQFLKEYNDLVVDRKR